MPLNALKGVLPENVRMSTYADVTGSWNQESLNLAWTTDIGLNGTSVLRRTSLNRPSDITTVKMDWDLYKQRISDLPWRKFLFRGQNEPWRLRTSFHRSDRADLSRFVAEDIPALHRHLSARTRHVFNLANPDENGSFFSLIQHHGYPTPLLDWTYSPYVAVFFAFRGITNVKAEAAPTGAVVRVLVLDHERWKASTPQSNMLAPATLHVSVREFIAIENERMIPQQAASMITNVDDIESFIASKESNGTPYLTAVDLPISERTKAIRELGLMGITAGALFPGLDGACEELAERNF